MPSSQALGSAPASAETQDAQFAGALKSGGLDPGSAEDRATVSSNVCKALDADVPVGEVLKLLQNELQTSERNTGFVLGAATSIYCPDDLAKLKAS